MKKIGFIIISIFTLLVGCNLSNEPIKEEKSASDFNLVIESKSSIFQESKEIQINSYLEYVGEKEIQLESKPLIVIYC